MDKNYSENEIEKNLIVFLKSMIVDEKCKRKSVKMKSYSTCGINYDSTIESHQKKYNFKSQREIYSIPDNNLFTIPMPTKNTSNIGFKPIQQQNHFNNHNFMNNIQFDNSMVLNQNINEPKFQDDQFSERSSISNVLNMQGENIHVKNNPNVPALDSDVQSIVSNRTHDILPQFKIAALLLAQTIKQIQDANDQKSNFSEQSIPVNVNHLNTIPQENNSVISNNNPISGNNALPNTSDLQNLDLFTN